MNEQLTRPEAQEWLKLDKIWETDRPYLNITGQMTRYKELSHKASVSGMSISAIQEAAK